MGAVRGEEGHDARLVGGVAGGEVVADRALDVRKLRWLDPFLGALMLNDISLEVIDAIKAEKLKAAGKPTVNRYLALVRALLLRAPDEWEWIAKAPRVKLFKEGPGRERSITVEQAATLLGELPAHQRDVVIFALATGLLQSNVLGLEWSRVNLEAGHAWVGCGSVQESQADRGAAQCDGVGGVAQAGG